MDSVNRRVSAARLRELFVYGEQTGLFVRRIQAGRVPAGAIAGAMNENGYVQIQVDGRLYKAHRLAFLYMTGEWPKNEVDHINGSRADNRWDNLRDVLVAVNRQNKRAARADSAVGVLGVQKRRAARPYYSSIRTGDQKVHLGSFATAEEAHQAYVEAKRRLHPGCTI